MCNDINILALIIGIILIIFIIYKYFYNKKYKNNKLIYNIMSELPIITKYYL